MSEVAPTLIDVLAVFGLAFLVRVAVRDRDRVSFASLLVVVGVVVAALGVSVDLPLTPDAI